MGKGERFRNSRPNEIAGWIMFGNRQRNRPTLLVEGSSDVRVYRSIVSESCRLFYADGKHVVLEAMKLIRQATYPGVVAIVDADFGRLNNELHDRDDVISTDTHDIETLVIRQVPALVRFVDNYCSCDTSHRDSDTYRSHTIARELQENVIQNGSIIGHIRFISARGKLNFDFAQFNHSRVYRVVNCKISVDMDALETEIICRCNISNSPVKWSVISGHVENLRALKSDLWQVCCGHDLTNLLAIYLRGVGVKMTKSEVERALSICFDALEFTGTEMYAKLAQWESQHPDYVLLRHPSTYRPAS